VACLPHKLLLKNAQKEKMISYLKKAKDFVVKYWKIFAAAVYGIGLWIYFSGKVGNIKEVIKVKEDSHKKQLDVVQEAHKQEIVLRDEALAEYNAALEAIRAEYKEKKMRLSKKRKEEVARIVEENKGNPSGLAKELSEKFGVTYVGSGEA
jgi:hypothetical protein